jgi:HSP20 family protein
MEPACRHACCYLATREAAGSVPARLNRTPNVVWRQSMYLTPVRRSLDPMTSLRRLNSVLDEAFSAWPFQNQENGTLTSSWLPACDVFEDKDAVKIVAEIPGVRPEDVKISLENNLLTIRGEKQQQAEENNERVHRYERTYGTFERTFVLPNTVDPERIEAHSGDGILTVLIPKSEQARPREIPVRASAGKTSDSVSAGTKRPSLGRDPEEEGSAGKTRG